MLEIKNLISGYTKNNNILKGIDLLLLEDEVAAIVGQNGSGKSTFAKSIMGMVPFIKGNIVYNGKSLIGISTSGISDFGIGFFMQGGRIFPHLTVDENLDFAGASLLKNKMTERKNTIREYFNLLKNNSRDRLKASYLSGGEQHQLALAMILMKQPSFLILDEPSAGLSPANVKSLYNVLKVIKENEVKNILIIEQNVNAVIGFSDRVILLKEGKFAKEEKHNNLGTSELIDEFYFGKIDC
jgi:branched-chain amino acid transport system ATP-binding protein